LIEFQKNYLFCLIFFTSILVQYARSKATYFATRFKDSTFGSGTKDRNLDRQHASRCETDLGNIKSQYQAQYGVSLASDVSVSPINS